MLVDNPSALDHQALDPDCVVVVGAGAVGIHLAVQLVRRGRTVVVLESGTRMIDSFPAETFQVVGRKHEGIQIGRSVALGGTTNLWGGQLVEFMPIDIEGRDWLPGSRWPIRYSDLASYYPSTYDALGIESRFQDDDVVWDGIRKKPPDLINGVELFLTRWMKLPNFASHFRSEVESNPSLIVVLGATVVGFEANEGNISGVQVVDNEGSRHIIHGQQIVLGAGTIENSRLLLHTATDPSFDCPWRNNDNIGRFFQDHLGGRLAYIRPHNAKAFFNVFCTIILHGQKFQPKVRLSNEALKREKALGCQGMTAFESSIRENLIFLQQFVKAAIYSRKIGSLKDLALNIFACSRHMIPLMWKFIVEHRILIPSGSRISLFLQSEVEPQRESRISVDPSVRDRFGLPKVVLDWHLSGRELQDILSFTRHVERALREAGLADLDIEPSLVAQDPSFLDSLRDTNHQAGGCVMGESSNDAVVDRNLRVFGTDNLYIVGACVFPTSSSANCTFTAMTLATRLADHLTRTSYEPD